MASKVESSTATVKSQPKSILKKQPKGARKSTPLFFTGNESNLINNNDDDYTVPAHTHVFNREQLEKADRKKVFNAQTRKESCDENDSGDESSSHHEEDVFDSLSPLRSSNLNHKLQTRRPPHNFRHRRNQSAVYIFHSKEINAEIIKILVASTETFMERFTQSLPPSDRTQSESDIFNKYRNSFIISLREFLTNNDALTHNQDYSNKLGASLSEPLMCTMDHVREQIKAEETARKKKESQNKANKVMVTGHESLEINKIVDNFISSSDPNMFGSLPTSSYLDAYSRELKLREIVLLKNLYSLQESNNDSSIINYTNMSQNHLKNMNDRNKCIANAASTTRKIVRFADSFGLDLERVRIITNNSFLDAFSMENADEEPGGEENAAAEQTVVSKPFLVLIPLFSIRKSDSQLIKLDNYIYDYENKIIKCIVRVKNICYEKNIYARITFNNWKSNYDLNAFYIKSEGNTMSNKNFSNSFDYFGFCIIIPEKSSLSSDNSVNKQSSTVASSGLDDCIYRIEFALCFRENTKIEHWDNNGGENYKFQVFFNK